MSGAVGDDEARCRDAVRVDEVAADAGPWVVMGPSSLPHDEPAVPEGGQAGAHGVGVAVPRIELRGRTEDDPIRSAHPDRVGEPVLRIAGPVRSHDQELAVQARGIGLEAVHDEDRIRVDRCPVRLIAAAVDLVLPRPAG